MNTVAEPVRSVRVHHAASAHSSRHRREGGETGGESAVFDTIGSVDKTLKFYDSGFHDLLK